VHTEYKICVAKIINSDIPTSAVSATDTTTIISNVTTNYFVTIKQAANYCIFQKIILQNG